MTNEELKKKIVEILNDVTTEPMIYKGRYLGDTQMPELKINAIADALIAAGIGDVSELKKHRVVVEKSLIPEDDNAYVLPNIPPTVKQLYSGEEVEQIVKERKEYKHRAEVAERAVREFAVQVGCRSCPCKGRCDISNPSAENDYQECYEAALRIAEKELAEEERK